MALRSPSAWPKSLPPANPGCPCASRARCLWACGRSCTVHVRAPGKPGYVLCELEPTTASAEGLVEYARLYALSAEGAVPFKTWPAAVRGHFLCRIPAVAESIDTAEEPP